MVIRPTPYAPMIPQARKPGVAAGGGTAVPAATTTVTLGSVSDLRSRLGITLDRLVQGLRDGFHRLVARFKQPAAPKPAPAPKKPETRGPYTVKPGDTLSRIAASTLGDAQRWREIYELNKATIGPNPNLIRAGMTLQLPGGAKITPTPPPTSRRVKAPYINQYSPAGKSGGYTNGAANCGPTSMAMIARAFGYGKGMTDAQLITRLGRMGGTNGNGTNVNGIAAMAQGIGKTAQTRGPGAHVDWIADQLRAGKLVVANGDYFAMAPHENPSRSSGHYVAVVGMEGRNFLVHDPADRNVHKVSPEAMAKFIRSNPNGGYQIAVG